MCRRGPYTRPCHRIRRRLDLLLGWARLNGGVSACLTRGRAEISVWVLLVVGVQFDHRIFRGVEALGLVGQIRFRCGKREFGTGNGL